MQIPVAAVVTAVALSVVFGTALVWIGRRHRERLDRFDERLAHLMAGISLLTDTAETGLRDVSAEIGRLATMSGSAGTRPRAAVERRMAGAARHGRSVQEIAAEEQVSEGEVRLRLELEKARREAALHAPMC